MMQKLKLALQRWILEPEYHIWEPWEINTFQNVHDRNDGFIFTRIYQQRQCKLCRKTEVCHEDSNKKK